LAQYAGDREYPDTLIAVRPILNFKQSNHKAAYAYLLTPRLIEQKAHITVHFLKKKMQEYEQLKQELAELQREVNSNRGPGSGVQK